MTQIPPTIDSLPKQFVTAMRTLFDIMDDKRTGYVRLTDIENRWRDDRTRGLPKGVIESLQKVASHNGLLTFDRFCAGLNLCLLRNQTEKAPRQLDLLNDNLENEDLREQTKPHMQRPPSVPSMDVDDIPTQHSKLKFSAHPQGLEGTHQHRTVSMPHLLSRADQLGLDGQVLRYGLDKIGSAHLPQSHAYGPPKPPRAEKPQNGVKDEVLTNLHNFTKHSHNLDTDVKDDLKSVLPGETIISRDRRGLGDGKPAADPPAVPHKVSSRRREPRRHTLQNGIDYNVLKRMKQIEQEKDILVQGLAAIEQAREWYLKQLGEVQEKMRYASRMGTHVEQWTEAQQERLELQRARVLELNRQLGALAEGWRRGGLSLHMNLALQPHTAHHTSAATLKHQNHLLTEEVTKKSERISVLEREKSALIRELLVTTKRNQNVDNIF